MGHHAADQPGPRPPAPLRRFVGWFLDLLYTELAWAYDLVATLTSAGQWWTWQRAVDGALPQGRLLELGFGTGRLLREFLTEGRQVFGVDVSAQMARITRARLVGAGLPLHLTRASALALPFPDGAFAGAYATFPSDYILQAETLREALRVLDSDGLLVIVPVARIRAVSAVDRLAEWLYRTTGQSGPLPAGWDRPLKALDVHVRVETVPQPRAEVVRIVIAKRGGRADTIRPRPGDGREGD